jgi:RNA polymerase sigma-70 factor (ECF subfamily)
MNAERRLHKLIDRIVSDDATAYKELFLLYHHKLLLFSRSITLSTEAAEEIASDVFLKIWLKRKSLNEIENLHLYLYVSTKNLSINYVLKQKREKVFSLDETIVEFRSLYYDPEQLLITAEMLKRIQLAVLQLPPRCQLIFKLVKEDGLKYKEVAELLHLSLKTVENQMTIALHRIQESVKFDLTRTFSSN